MAEGRVKRTMVDEQIQMGHGQGPVPTSHG